MLIAGLDKIGYQIPVVEISGMIVANDSLRSITIDHGVPIPRLSLTVNLDTNLFLRNFYPRIGMHIRIRLQFDESAYAPIDAVFIINSVESDAIPYSTVRDANLQIEAELYVKGLYEIGFNACTGTSVYTIEQIAKSCELGFVSNYQVADMTDRQTWLQLGKNRLDWIASIALRSASKDPESIPIWFVDLNRKLHFIDLNRVRKGKSTSIEGDRTYKILSRQPSPELLKRNPDGVETVKRLVASNNPNFQYSNIYILSFKKYNNYINDTQGIHGENRFGQWLPLQGKHADFQLKTIPMVKGRLYNETTHIPVTPTNVAYDEFKVLYEDEWVFSSGIQYTDISEQDGSGNVHPTWNRTRYNNALKLYELTTEASHIVMRGWNMSVDRTVNLSVALYDYTNPQSSAGKETFTPELALFGINETTVFDKINSGDYTPTGIKYIWTSNEGFFTEYIAYQNHATVSLKTIKNTKNAATQ
jgi:hypothetical protein